MNNLDGVKCPNWLPTTPGLGDGLEFVNRLPEKMIN